MENSHETTIGPADIHEYQSHTVAILVGMATILVAVLTIYLTFFESQIIS